MSLKNHRSNKLLAELIACQSITPRDSGCQELIKKHLEPLGFKCETLNFGEVRNLWATMGKDGPTLCFAGHTDVVPPGPIQDWKFDPFKATFNEDFIYGRGASDMKSGLAAMVTGTADFLKMKENFNGRIAFLITSDEEGPAIDGTKKVINELKKRKENIDWCIVGEPSSMKVLGDTIKVGRRGSLTGFLKIKGIQGHVAYPYLAVNPYRLIAPIMSDLLDIEWDKGNEFFPATNLEIVNISGSNDAVNVIPGEVELIFNFRFNNIWNYKRLKSKIHNVLDKNKVNYELLWRESGEPYLTKEGDLTQTSQQVIRELVGIEPTLSTDGGTSDGRFFAPLGVQVIELGSINSTIHKVNESVPIDDTPQLAKIYFEIMNSLFV
ncbi:MAG TPA: succinyl-diaminopimelate desuccinylase [Woeseiaceae bacterium]|nr:succinyl-diaminopimelate desuccinylase [Woeseiaceae bacterium]|tara:strand:- start:5622 stop:6761 length:1140 start_codon:yes stop_codon:yes gene_type:complete